MRITTTMNTIIKCIVEVKFWAPLLHLHCFPVRLSPWSLFWNKYHALERNQKSHKSGQRSKARRHCAGLVTVVQQMGHPILIDQQIISTWNYQQITTTNSPLRIMKRRGIVFVTTWRGLRNSRNSPSCTEPWSSMLLRHSICQIFWQRVGLKLHKEKTFGITSTLAQRKFMKEWDQRAPNQNTFPLTQDQNVSKWNHSQDQSELNCKPIVHHLYSFSKN